MATELKLFNIYIILIHIQRAQVERSGTTKMAISVEKIILILNF